MFAKEIFREWAGELNQSLLDSNVLSIALFSTNKELIFANKAMSSLFTGEAWQNLLNPTFDKLLLLDNSNSLIFEGYLTLGDYSSINTSIDAQIFRKNGKVLIVGGVIASQLIDQNKIVHKLNRDLGNMQRELVKEKHVLESTLQQLNLANEELEKLNTGKDRFISILAHDLKNPFTSILGFLEILRKKVHSYDANKIDMQLSIIHNAAISTFNLLEDILLWVNAESGKLTFSPQKVNIKDVCIDVELEMKLSANNKEIALNNTVEDVFVHADMNMISLIFRNLISNALKFTRKGGQINISAIQADSEVVITVSDNGIGMRHEVLSKLFDISHKVTTKGTENEHGTGLGLLLCKEFVEAHGGRIWVESEFGKGSDFRFTIPQ
ncbi:MAG: HAMP domain-containing sensor histidine kinase [Salinivirgaceae bacterium]|jgi:two-component system sensor histidine kinase/response regulator|nr:HAMP domain-containing sensor histidine kinase [Salinivirgaceae bacterium]